MAELNLSAEWAAVSSAPYISIGALILVVGVVWAIVHFLYKHQIGGLKRDVESEQSESTRLRGRISEYEQKAGRTPDEAHEKIETLERRVASLAGRRLTEVQKEQLAAALAPTPATVHLQHAMGTPDAVKFQRDLDEVFRRAGWGVVDGFIIGGPQNEHGLSVILYRNSASFQVLSAALRAIGFDSAIWDQSDSEEPKADVGLLISPRSG